MTARGGRGLALRFGLAFPLLAGGLLVAATFAGPVLRLRESLVDATLWVSARLFPLLGWAVRPDARDARVLRAPDGHGVRLAPECDGLVPVLLLTAAALVTPTRWSRRLGFAAAGSTALLLLNQARIAHLLSISDRDPDGFRFAHESAWPAGLTVAALALYALWASRALREG